MTGLVTLGWRSGVIALALLSVAVFVLKTDAQERVPPGREAERGQGEKHDLAPLAGFERPGPGEQELPPLRAGEELRKAPEFSLSDIGGARIGLRDIHEPVVILHFWSKFRRCEEDLQLLQKLQGKYADKGVKIVSLVYSSGAREEIRAFLDELDVEVTTLMCSYAVKEAYDVPVFPMTFALDGERNIRYWMFGILVESHWDRLIGEMAEQKNAASTP